VEKRALDARLLPAQESSVHPPVPVQPQLQALNPPPLRARLTAALAVLRLGAPWPCWNLCARARVPVGFSTDVTSSHQHDAMPEYLASLLGEA